MDKYQQTLDKLFTLLPMFQREGAAAYKADLKNIKILLKALGNPHEKFKSIHIAGTNGKGSTAHILAALLQANGMKVGLHTSPHYIDFRERIKINGELINKNTVIEFYEQHHELLEEVQASFFEASIALTFLVFEHENVDIAIVETGLGGRLDSTNVLIPLLSIITNIGYDHMEFLGSTLSEIASEKAGIIKPHTPVLLGERQDDIREVFLSSASANEAPIFFADEMVNLHNPTGALDNLSFNLWIKEEKCKIHTDISGYYQFQNIRTALAAYKLIVDEKLLDVSWSCKIIGEALSDIKGLTYFIGRWQVLSDKPVTIVDSAHNKEGIIESLAQIKEYEKEILHIVIGFVSDKNWQEILHMLPRHAYYYCVSPDVPRGLDVAQLHSRMVLEGFKAWKYAKVLDGLKAAYDIASEYDVIYVVGSSFVAAEAIQWERGS